MSVKRPFNVSMFQLLGIILVTVFVSWNAAKVFHERKKGKENDMKTLLIIIVTTIAILVAQYLYETSQIEGCNQMIEMPNVFTEVERRLIDRKQLSFQVGNVRRCLKTN